jgi:hypothetical protein
LTDHHGLATNLNLTGSLNHSTGPATSGVITTTTSTTTNNQILHITADYYIQDSITMKLVNSVWNPTHIDVIHLIAASGLNL